MSKALITIYRNGKYIKVDDSTLELLRPGVLNVDGVFETLRIYKGNVYLLEQHLERLMRGLKLYKIYYKINIKQFRRIINRLIKINHLSDARLRIAVWRKGKFVESAIVCQKLVPIKNDVYIKGYNVEVSSFIRNLSKYSHVKSLDYQIFYEAKKKARAHGFDEAILLNQDKYLVEASSANLFFIKNNVLYSPAIQCGCLNGITREIILKLASQNKIKSCIGNFTLKDLISSDEAFLTNSIIGVLPITRISGKKIAHCKQGKMTNEFLDLYRKNLNS